MTVEKDVLRALVFGSDSYFHEIQKFPSYQAELERVRRDYNERTWIDFSGFLPKFTTAEFEKRRISYQAKYGNSVNVPGFSDVIHIVPKARISAEERAAHLWASKRGLPSPLTPAQLDSLAYKKFRFLKALSSPTPTWMKNYGAVMTALDNVEDALVTINVLGRIASKYIPRLMGKFVPGMGWVLLGADILNAVNIMSWVSFSAMGAKRSVEGLAEKNPFHAKAKAARIQKMKGLIPHFGEILEVLQTTDQLFGIGLCLGGFMGIVTDLSSKVMSYSANDLYDSMPKTGNINTLTRWANKGFASDVTKFKKTLTEQWTNFKDEAYRLKETDYKIRNEVMKIAKDTEGIVWDKLKGIPEKASSWFSNSLIGSMIMSTGKDDFLKEDHTKAFIMLDQSIQGLMPWWIENNPLEAFKDLRGFMFRPPDPTDPSTIDILNDRDPDWQNSVKWPHLDKEYATIEEIVFSYSPMIKDSFQTYCLKYRHEYTAMIAAQQAVEFVKNVIRSYSDDHQVTVGMSAYWAVAEDMARDIYLIPPGTADSLITSLADFIGEQERKTAVAPNIKEVVSYGKSIGIEWMRTFPKRAFDAAADSFPEWQKIQDQIGDLYFID